MTQRTKVYVTPSTRSTFLYGFLTSLDDAERQALGHTVLTGQNSSGVVFGANSPKPARMKKTRDSGRSANSFVSAGSIASARTAGWKLIKRPTARRSRATALSKPVYVELSIGSIKVKYAWRMPTDLYTSVGTDRTALGITDASTETDAFDLVWGVNSPKPPRAYKVNGDSTLATFCDPNATLPTGWSLVGGETDTSV